MNDDGWDWRGVVGLLFAAWLVFGGGGKAVVDTVFGDDDPPTAQVQFTNTNSDRFTPLSSSGRRQVRVGAWCRVGTWSNATGSGACSWHGGVASWVYG